MQHGYSCNHDGAQHGEAPLSISKQLRCTIDSQLVTLKIHFADSIPRE